MLCQPGGQSLRSRCRRGWLPPKAPEGHPSCLSQLLGAPGPPGLWPRLSSFGRVFAGPPPSLLSPLLSLIRMLADLVTSAETHHRPKQCHIHRYMGGGGGGHHQAGPAHSAEEWGPQEAHPMDAA